MRKTIVLCLVVVAIYGVLLFIAQTEDSTPTIGASAGALALTGIAVFRYKLLHALHAFKESIAHRFHKVAHH